MKNKYLAFLVVFVVVTFTYAQTPKIIGLRNSNPNASGGSLDVVTWNLGETQYITQINNVGSAVVIGTSFFDAFTGNYYARFPQAMSPQGSFFNFNTLLTSTSFIDIFAEVGMQETVVDMENGNYYFFQNVNGLRRLVVSDASLDNMTILGNYPDVPVVSVRSATFDSNNKVFYFLGIVNSQLSLIKTNVANNAFSYQILPITNMPQGGQVFVGYSNRANKLYTLHTTGNFLAQTLQAHVGELNTTTAAYQSLFDVDDLKVFVSLNVSFDQESQSFVALGRGYVPPTHIFWINCFEETSAVYPIPNDILLEIQCDNFNFAQTFFSPLSVNEETFEEFSVYPNPTSDVLIAKVKGSFDYSIYHVNGQRVQQGKISEATNQIDVKNLASGMYFIQISSADLSKSLKFVKQ